MSRPDGSEGEPPQEWTTDIVEIQRKHGDPLVIRVDEDELNDLTRAHYDTQMGHAGAPKVVSIAGDLLRNPWGTAEERR